MADFELRNGQGRLFRNRDKREDKHPDFKGSIKIGGKEYKVAVWEKRTKSDEPWLSFQVDRRDLEQDLDF